MFSELKKAIKKNNINFDSLLTEAKALLSNSDNNNTAYQDNWEAAFMALGIANYDIEKAKSIFRSIFNGQWSNGFLPHKIFENKADASLWQTPVDSLSSGITIPPVHGFVLWTMYEKAEDKKSLLPFLKEMYPKVLACHQYLYKHRDPEEEGLIYIRHPWETALKNSPLFDELLSQKEALDLIALFQNLKYEESAIYKTSPFLIQDPLFNAILCKSNECMINIASVLDEDVTELVSWHELTIYSMNDKLWDDERGIYDAYDLRQNQKIINHTLSGLIPLFGIVPTQEQAEKILLVLEDERYSGTRENPFYLCTSYNALAKDMDYTKHHRGAICMQLNWMMYHGMQNFSFYQLAAKLQQNTMQLISTYGFAECFDPRKTNNENAAFGKTNSPSTAALCIDLLYTT